MKRKIVFLCLVVVICTICSFSSLAASPIGGFKHYIRCANYTIYIPDQYINYLDFSDDDFLFFRSSSSVSCLLKYDNSQVLFSITFPSVYRSNTTSLTYRTFEDYYSDAVTVQTGSGVSSDVRRISPIKYDDIMESDISFGFKSEYIIYGVFVILVCDLILKIFLIFSKGKTDDKYSL